MLSRNAFCHTYQICVRIQTDSCMETTPDRKYEHFVRKPHPFLRIFIIVAYRGFIDINAHYVQIVFMCSVRDPRLVSWNINESSRKKAIMLIERFEVNRNWRKTMSRKE